MFPENGSTTPHPRRIRSVNAARATSVPRQMTPCPPRIERNRAFACRSTRFALPGYFPHVPPTRLHRFGEGRPIMTACWLIIADDLTGAADCAVAFAKRGLDAAVLWGHGEDSGASVLSVDADSRHLPAAEAAARQLTAQAAHWRPGVRLYKKIDSTLRGQPAAELAAQLRARAGATRRRRNCWGGPSQTMRRRGAAAPARRPPRRSGTARCGAATCR